MLGLARAACDCALGASEAPGTVRTMVTPRQGTIRAPQEYERARCPGRLWPPGKDSWLGWGLGGRRSDRTHPRQRRLGTGWPGGACQAGSSSVGPPEAPRTASRGSPRRRLALRASGMLQEYLRSGSSAQTRDAHSLTGRPPPSPSTLPGHQSFLALGSHLASLLRLCRPVHPGCAMLRLRHHHLGTG